VRLTVELANHTIVRLLLVKDFKTAREFKPYEFVRLRSLYLPNLINENVTALEQELALA
jgi:hypothetical protein